MQVGRFSWTIVLMILLGTNNNCNITNYFSYVSLYCKNIDFIVIETKIKQFIIVPNNNKAKQSILRNYNDTENLMFSELPPIIIVKSPGSRCQPFSGEYTAKSRCVR